MIKILADVLSNTQYSDCTNSIEKTPFEKLYKIGNKQTGYYSVKIRNNNDFIRESIQNINDINDTHKIILKYKDTIQYQDLYFLISKWEEGNYISSTHLPELFTEIAILNKNNKSDGPYTSMYLDGKKFKTQEELLDFELNYLLSFWTDVKIKSAIRNEYQNLRYGFCCIINEDLHRNNVLVENKEIKIIDTEWIIKGINLYQFQHFDIFGFENGSHCISGDIAFKCYRAYFKELEIKEKDAISQIKAIEILNLLRQNTFWRYNKQSEMYGEELKRLEKIMNYNYEQALKYHEK